MLKEFSILKSTLFCEKVNADICMGAFNYLTRYHDNTNQYLQTLLWTCKDLHVSHVLQCHKMFRYFC